MPVSVHCSTPHSFRTGPSNAFLDKSKYYGLRGGVSDQLSRGHSSMPYPSHGYPRANELSASSSAPRLQRWDFESQDSSGSSMPPPPSQKLLPKSDVKQESVKDLAAFLRTREPPRDNYMSIPESDTSSTYSGKNSPFQLFGRRKQRKVKKYKKARLLRLPDSAVAAKTRSGSVHIAISIPVQYNQAEAIKISTSAWPAKVANVQNHKALNPLLESRESTSTLSSREKDSNGRPFQESMRYPIVVHGSESARPLWSLYKSPNERHVNGTGSTSGAANPQIRVGETPRGQRKYIAVSPTGLLGGGGFHTFVQQAAGSLPNPKNSVASKANTSGQSNAASTPAIHLQHVQLPPRLSSIPPTVPLSLEASLVEFQREREVDFLSLPAPPPTTSLPKPPISSSPSSSIRERPTAQNLPMIFGTATARTAQSYNKTHVELHTISRPHSPRLSNASSIAAGPGPGEPPKRKLPDLPVRRSQDSRRARSSPGGSCKSACSAKSITSNEERKTTRDVHAGAPSLKETEVETEEPEQQDAPADSCKVLMPLIPTEHNVQHTTRKDSCQVLTPTTPAAPHKEQHTRKDSCQALTPVSPSPSIETHLSRQERVRQRKMRDLRNSRTLSNASQYQIAHVINDANKEEPTSSTVNAEPAAQPVNPSSTTNSPYKAAPLLSALPSLRERRFNVPPPLVTSPILQVAWLPPYEGQVLETDLPFTSPRIPPKNPRRNTNPNLKAQMEIAARDISEEQMRMPKTCPSYMVQKARDEKEGMRWRGRWNDTWCTTPRPLRYPSRGRSGFRPSEPDSDSPPLPARTPSHSPRSASGSSSISSSPSPHTRSHKSQAHSLRALSVSSAVDTENTSARERSMSESRRKLECKRRERRMRRNISLQLRELEDRVRRMEKENRECRVVREVVVGVVRGLERRV